MKKTIFVVFMILGTVSLSAKTPTELIGSLAPGFHVNTWLNGNAIKMSELKGQVVLVRFWTDACPFCARTAPTLNEFHEKYSRRGLIVIGLFTPKPSPQLVSIERVQKAIKRFGFKFPVGIDSNWKTLKKWWLDRVDSKWTSISFLLDRHGIIRHIHPGGDYYATPDDPKSRPNRDYKAMKRAIEQLL